MNTFIEPTVVELKSRYAEAETPWADILDRAEREVLRSSGEEGHLEHSRDFTDLVSILVGEGKRRNLPTVALSRLAQARYAATRLDGTGHAPALDEMAKRFPSDIAIDASSGDNACGGAHEEGERTEGQAVRETESPRPAAEAA